eukprot:11098712-Karenia_brevis.AAC.1
MGFVKDMREGQVYLKDYDDYLDVYRVEGSGLTVVDISHFPRIGEGAMRLSDFVPAVAEKCKEKSFIFRTRSESPGVPCPTLSALPATTRRGQTTPRAPK